MPAFELNLLICIADTAIFTVNFSDLFCFSLKICANCFAYLHFLFHVTAMKLNHLVSMYSVSSLSKH